jgi:hypothetical protein
MSMLEALCKVLIVPACILRYNMEDGTLFVLKYGINHDQWNNYFGIDIVIRDRKPIDTC